MSKGSSPTTNLNSCHRASSSISRRVARPFDSEKKAVASRVVIVVDWCVCGGLKELVGCCGIFYHVITWADMAGSQK
jgi:hypothetical protein